jgi:hypothetical protein
MPIALLLEILDAIVALAPGIPQVLTLGQSAANILKAGSVTPAEEASIRAQLDTARAVIDAA